MFASSLASRGISFATIKVYLSGVQHQNVLFGFPGRIADMPRLYELLRGIRRSQGNSLRRVQRSRFTVPHLFMLMSFLSASRLSAHDRAMLKAATLLPFLVCFEYQSSPVPLGGGLILYFTWPRLTYPSIPKAP